MDNDFKGFPTFQYSEFLNGRDSGQFVVRSNSLEEFTRAVAEAKQLFATSVAKTPPVSVSVAQTPTAEQVDYGRGVPPTNIPTTSNAPVCPIHQKSMRFGKNGHWFCATKLPDGTWCKTTI